METSCVLVIFTVFIVILYFLQNCYIVIVTELHTVKTPQIHNNYRPTWLCGTSVGDLLD